MLTRRGMVMDPLPLAQSPPVDMFTYCISVHGERGGTKGAVINNNQCPVTVQWSTTPVSSRWQPVPATIQTEHPTAHATTHDWRTRPPPTITAHAILRIL